MALALFPNHRTSSLLLYSPYFGVSCMRPAGWVWIVGGSSSTLITGWIQVICLRALHEVYLCVLCFLCQCVCVCTCAFVGRGHECVWCLSCVCLCAQSRTQLIEWRHLKCAFQISSTAGSQGHCELQARRDSLCVCVGVCSCACLHSCASLFVYW